ncbi:ParB/RepB/Spo0J family partition protein [Conexibacter sp. W3-3-2]|uniref:ParB/RepB/Spo0J family partition protein n=1 Tax=Conexibacter sp. W3-3-2 TaxID=2675227 RepID=UPI001326CA16|nr:ParB/RepB/Spo0J family partition protein [Conexibacter sp. W3-3-2]MTD45549.1 ParB/RepB/Spo0J family partition protein [Conexibacter sp. W3-3-2]
MAEKRGMGRGLSAILSVTAEDVAGPGGAAAPEGDELRELPVGEVHPNPNQPRKRFDEEALQALADSLGERGVLQPVLVRPAPGGAKGYEIVAGERRWRAAQIAGLAAIPAIVRERDDATTLEDALIENMARQDLNPVEEARAVAGLVEELGLTREAVGKRIGRSRVAVSNLLRLLDLPEEALDLLESGALTEGHGRALLMAEDHADRRRLARAAADQGWSVRVLEEQARQAGTAGARSATRGRAAIHPDQAAAAEDIAAALGAALGADLKVKPRGTGYRVELTFDSPDEALALAERLGVSVG